MKHVFPSQRLHEDLRKLIASSETGQKLPSEPELARKLGVARATLREALRVFETQGMLYRRQGSGTYVMKPAHVLDSGLEVLESIETMAVRNGLSVKVGDWKVENRTPTEEETAALGLEAGKSVVSISRVVLADNLPVAYLIDVLPEDVLSADDLSAGFTGSVLDLLLKRGAPQLAFSRTEINAIAATGEVGRLVGLQRGAVLLRFVAQLYTTTNRVIDYSFSYFLPGYFRFHVVRRIG